MELPEEIGRPRNLPARAQTRSSSSLSRAFSMRRCCSSSDTSPSTAAPPQLAQMGLRIASRIVMFSALSLSFSCLSSAFSCRSICVFICVRRFWNQNLTWRLSRLSRLLSSILCFSSGWGHSLNTASSSWICCGVWRWYRFFFLRGLLLSGSISSTGGAVDVVAA
uniref:Uncharacterized protein n=1 Tax=Zea mays TaxID=4577 RepID=C4J6X0_MAIZE|nr:unknown [Zea mays]